MLSKKVKKKWSLITGYDFVGKDAGTGIIW